MQATQFPNFQQPPTWYPQSRGMIIDNFAGGGGTSEGLEQAFGRPVDVAINHDPEALAMHAINHPHSLHLCESVWDVNPLEVTKGRPVELVWLSPDCKHFSKAKGATPVSKHIRGLAWVGIRWVALTKPMVLMLENVEEFVTWGPLMRVEKEVLNEAGELETTAVWMPDPTKKGVTFQSFVRQLQQHGYQVEWRELRACDNGAPTIRKRLFLIARRDGFPIFWPEQTHGEPTHKEVIAGNMSPHRTAAECINFNLASRSVFGRPRELARNTQRRVAKGLWRHVLTNAQPFFVNTRNGEREGQQPRIRSLHEPFWTVTGAGSQGALSQPVLEGVDDSIGAAFITEHANASTQRTMPADEPLRTICAQVKGGHFSVVEPKVTPIIVINTTGHSGARLDQPLPTITTGGHHALVAPVISPLRGTSEGHMGSDSVQEPLSTISAGGTHHAMIAAHLVDMGHGESCATGAIRWSHGVRSLDRPLNTVTASGATSALAAVHLTHLTHHGERFGYGVGEPFKTITGAHRGEQALVAACLEQANGGFMEKNPGHPVTQPMSTIMSRGANQRLIGARMEESSDPNNEIVDEYAQQLMSAYIVEYDTNGDLVTNRSKKPKAGVGSVKIIRIPSSYVEDSKLAKAKACADLLHEHLPEDFQLPADVVLVLQNERWYVLVDITLRMLKPRELFNAQGFPENYIIEHIPDPKILFANGKQTANPLDVPRIPLSLTAQVRMCGNSVSPYQSFALARANFAMQNFSEMRAAA